MVILTDNQREELSRYRVELVDARIELERQVTLTEVCERNRVLDRHSLDAALVLVGELKAKVEALEKANP